MIRVCLPVLLASAILLGAGPLRAAEKPAFDRWISELGSDDLETRDAAQSNLAEAGRTLVREYRRAKARKSAMGMRKTLTTLRALAGALRQGCASEDGVRRDRAREIRSHLLSQTRVRLLFASRRNPGGRPPAGFAQTKRPFSRIFVTGTDGGKLHRLTPETEHCTGPVWSPDGNQIAYTAHTDGDEEIFVMDADGRNRTRLTRSPGKDSHPVFSPDGTRIAFLSQRSGRSKIFVKDRRSGEAEPLTKDHVSETSPAWHPSGAKIAYTSRIGKGPWAISVCSFGGSPERLTTGGASDYGPVWSPDGLRIAFLSTRDGGKPEIYVCNADGGNPVRLTSNAFTEAHPAWSPDGFRIAFTSYRNRSGHVFVMDADGGNERKLTAPRRHDIASRPAFCPDGSRIAFKRMLEL
jgi:Tol biopolymer transport system component